MARREFPPAHAAVPNLAPMIDVVMVILVFFMLGTTFAISEGVMKARLPTQVGPGGGAKIAMIPTVRIHLQQIPGADACRFLVMGKPVDDATTDALSRFMSQKRGEGADAAGPVQISADPGVRYQHVVSAMDACSRAGFTNLQLNVSGSAAAISRTP